MLTWSGESGDPHAADVAAVADALGVDVERGLDASEAVARLAASGPNELIVDAPDPLRRRLLRQFADPLILFLLVAVAIALLAWWAEGASSVPVDAIVIAAIIVVNAALGLVQEVRADHALKALADLSQPMSTVLREGALVRVRSAALVAGDVVVLAEGDRVGADGRLFQAHSLQASEASLTGESAPVRKQTAALPQATSLGDRSNMVFAGTAIGRGTGRAVVTETGMRTELGGVADLLSRTEEAPTPLQREVSRLGRALGIIVIGIALVVIITLTLVQDARTPADLVAILLLGVSLAVAAVPEGLPALLSVVLAVGAQRMAKRNAIVRSLPSVETLGSASVICTDKTGTLTTGEMTITRVLTSSGTADLIGGGREDPSGELLVDGRPAAPGPLLEDARRAIRIGALANDAQFVDGDDGRHAEGDSTDVAFLVAAHMLARPAEEVSAFERIASAPFTSERKRMSTVHRDRAGAAFVFCKGAPDVLIALCTRIRRGADELALTDTLRARLIGEVEALSAEGFRTLALAYRELSDSAPAPATQGSSASYEEDLVLVGVVGITDPPRPEVGEAIREAHDAGLRVVMITGDHPMTAVRVAADLGIAPSGAEAVAGMQLAALDEAQLRHVSATARVYARVAPGDKLRIVRALQSEGEIVAMTGDGVNDAPALKAADIGIAMGRTGTEVTKDAAKLILADDNFATIVAAVREGRVIFDNIRKFLRYLLSSNMGEVLTIFFGVVFAGVLGITQASSESLVLPLLATQVLWINLVTDSGPALAMGMDPDVDDVMHRVPRGRSEHAIDGAMWAAIVSTGMTMSVTALLTMDLFLPGGLLPGGSDTLAVARTAGFTTLVFAALLTAFNSRSATSSVLSGLFANRWLWGSVLLGVGLQIAVVYVPVLQVAFGTAPLQAAHWAACVGMASFVVWVEESRKAIMRRAAVRVSTDLEDE
ncbi:cation-translocating P-type ATPase [Microbacterium sulfonylureivorans]|uniref:cation-translocating P-type ATPase n=1 Tax=Microbacterium sulfonylureivorans TaxID=2486854 RepID=UPI000FDBCAB1|nr:cation-translocating P-type ATPase [Microbacterium sulfonylureivorans]